MSWLRFGDNGFFNPIVLRARALLRSCLDTVLERDVITCELLGFAIGCASLTAAFEGDYVVGYGTALSVSPVRADRLLDLAAKAGYMTELQYPVGGEAVWKLVDRPEFIHMIPRDAREWEATRKSDVANPALTVPVRVRDGDGCRYCGVVVNWDDRKSGRGATYDHRPPGKPATVATLFVCCYGCNRGRGNAEDADERFPLLPAPAAPYYSPATVDHFAKHPRHVPNPLRIKLNLTPAALSAGRTMTADEPSDPAPSRDARPATPQPAGQRTSADTTVSSAPAVGARSADPADPGCAGSGFAGSGRDGTGPGTGSGTDRSAGSRRRRGNRGRGSTKPR